MIKEKDTYNDRVGIVRIIFEMTSMDLLDKKLHYRIKNPSYRYTFIEKFINSPKETIDNKFYIDNHNEKKIEKVIEKVFIDDEDAKLVPINTYSIRNKIRMHYSLKKIDIKIFEKLKDFNKSQYILFNKNDPYRPSLLISTAFSFAAKYIVPDRSYRESKNSGFYKVFDKNFAILKEKLFKEYFRNEI